MPAFLEAFGKSVVEAMACSKPVVLSSNVGAVEILEGESKNFVLDGYSIEDAVRKLEPLINNKALRVDLGQLNATTSQKYTSEAHNRKLKEVFRHLNI